MSKLRTAKYKKFEWNKWINRGSKIARTAFDIYIGIKRREPIYIASGIASGAETISSWSEDQSIDIDQEMRSRGLIPMHNKRHIARFWYDTVRNIGLPCEKLTISKKVLGEQKALIYNLEGEDVFFVFDGTFLDSVYCVDTDKAAEAFSLTVQRHLGTYISLSTFTENWTTHMYLSKLDPKMDAYVSQINLEETVSSLRKFRSKGINRASLLYGPPGVGKTTFASALAKEMDTRLLVIESPPLNKLMDSGIRLDSLIDIVKPGIILFDDLDRVHQVEDLFGEVERLNRTCRENAIVMLASINRIRKLPPPLRRTGRFDETFEFVLPNAEWRKKILLSHLKFEGIRLKDSYVDLIVDWSVGLSGSDLREVALQVSVLGFEHKKIRSICERILYFKNIDKEEDDVHSVCDGSNGKCEAEPDVVYAPGV